MSHDEELMAQYIQASDCQAAETTDAPASVSHTLLQQRMERGVIRRARLAAIWLPSGDQEILDEKLSRLRSTIPSLTT